MMPVTERLIALEQFYAQSFTHPGFVAEVVTSGSYAKKVRALARHGARTKREVSLLCDQVNHLRCAFMIMDDLIDCDDTRNAAPAFWTVYGNAATIQQAAWHIAQARRIAHNVMVLPSFEHRLLEVIAGARLELTLELSGIPTACAVLPVLWEIVVRKEASFRIYLAEALGCSQDVCDAAYEDGIAAQILDDALSAQHGKDGRPADADERMGRLTYMVAFGVSAQDAERIGREMKARIAPVVRGN